MIKERVSIMIKISKTKMCCYLIACVIFISYIALCVKHSTKYLETEVGALCYHKFYTDAEVEEYQQLLIEDMSPLNKKIEKYCGYAPDFFAYPFYAISMPSIPVLSNDLGYKFLFAGESERVYRYCGESVHLNNSNNFEKGKKPSDNIIKRYTPHTGDDFAEIVNTIFE